MGPKILNISNLHNLMLNFLRKVGGKLDPIFVVTRDIMLFHLYFVGEDS